MPVEEPRQTTDSKPAAPELEYHWSCCLKVTKSAKKDQNPRRHHAVPEAGRLFQEAAELPVLDHDEAGRPPQTDSPLSYARHK